MKLKLKKDIIPLLMTLLLLGISIAVTAITNYKLGYAHYFGLSLVILSSVLYFKNKTFYRYLFGLTLLISSVGLVEFFFIGFGISFGMFGIGLNFNPINLTLFIIFLALNKEIIGQLFPAPKKSKVTDEEIKEKLEFKINQFENKFVNKSEMELKHITNLNHAYVDEARMAAERILNKKYASQHRR